LRELSKIAKFVVIPELEQDDLLPAISQVGRKAISDLVNGGGNLVMFAPGNGDLINFLNTIFSFNLIEGNVNEPISLTAVGSAMFSGLSSSLPDVSDTDSLDTTSLPFVPEHFIRAMDQTNLS
jgi:hypothetical protein